MSEISISREDAIMNIKAIRDLWDNEYDYKSEYRDFLEDDPIATLEKAISDMKKLEKIEALYEPKPFGQGLSREDRDRQIEQIVKG